MEINSVVENTWKFNNKDLNNGFLKNDSKIQESVDSLLTNSTPVATVVQVSGSGTQTVVHHPRKSRSARERLLLGVVFILIMVSSISLVMLINASAKCNKNGKFVIFFINFINLLILLVLKGKSFPKKLKKNLFC